ncbi:MAG: hypothetical protein ABIO43_09050 [Sphingomicrobium sp.]
MRLNLNLIQRGLLAVAGLLMILFALKSAEDTYGEEEWLPTLQFILAVVLFVIAASSGKAKKDGE